jgi:uncharacterized membrane protein YhaH (DUF805 family)
MSTSGLVITLGLLFWLTTCIALIDIARKDFGGIEKKAAWAFVALIPFIGVFIYLLLGYRKGQPKSQDMGPTG